jgi:hypothetical protein
VAYHPSEFRLASASDDTTVRLWDGPAGRESATIRAHQSQVNDVLFSPAGTEVASAAADGLVLVCDAISGRQLARLKFPDPARTLAWDRTGTRLIVGFGSPSAAVGDGRVRLWDWKAGTVIASREMPGKSAVESIAVDPVVDRIVVATSGAYDLEFWDVATSGAYDLEFWDAALTRNVATLPSVAPGARLAFFPDGQRLVSASGDSVLRIWDASTLKPLLNLTIPGVSTTALAVSPDGQRVAAAVAKEVRVWGSVSAYHPDAADLVGRLFRELEVADAVSARIRGDQGLDPKLREAALRIVRPIESEPNRLNWAAWKVVKSPGQSAAAYATAVQRAERAVEAAPWEAVYVHTLGLAHYRAGEWQAAIVAFERYAMLQPPARPEDLAFVSMAHQRLGHVDAARDALGKLRAEMARPYNAKSEWLQALLREAEALVAGAAERPAGAGAGRD